MTKTKRVAYDKAYRQTHKAEIAAQDKAYQKAHKTEIAAYYQAHKAEYAARSRVYQQTHKAEKAASSRAYYQAHKAECVASATAWRRAHLDKCADIKARRRARKLGATVEKVSRTVVYERDGGRCHRCGKKVPKKGWHLDHLIPLARGGEHSYNNVAVSHPKCNMSKGIKPSAKLRLF